MGMAKEVSESSDEHRNKNNLKQRLWRINSYWLREETITSIRKCVCFIINHLQCLVHVAPFKIPVLTFGIFDEGDPWDPTRLGSVWSPSCRLVHQKYSKTVTEDKTSKLKTEFHSNPSFMMFHQHLQTVIQKFTLINNLI